MGLFDRKIYSISNTLTHSRFHALTSFPQLSASPRLLPPLLLEPLCFFYFPAPGAFSHALTRSHLTSSGELLCRLLTHPIGISVAHCRGVGSLTSHLQIGSRFRIELKLQ